MALNRLAYNVPLYVGKAVPRGWRQGRAGADGQRPGRELFQRLQEHARSLGATADLNPADFQCRLLIFEGAATDMIGTLEAALIKIHRPLWNSTVDGFGNHDPGRGRRQQAASAWDVLHPGRPWAQKLGGTAHSRETVLAAIQAHFQEYL